MKRTQIKRTPLSDTVLASLEPEAKIYRVSDGNGLYFRVKPTGQKSWELRYKKADGKWSWLGLSGKDERSIPVDRWICAPLIVEAETVNTEDRSIGRLLSFYYRGQRVEWVMPMDALAGKGDDVLKALKATYLELQERLGLLLKSLRNIKNQLKPIRHRLNN